MAYGNNLAYDLSRFDRQSRQRREAAPKENTTQVDFTVKEPEKPKGARATLAAWRGMDVTIQKVRMSRLAKLAATCLLIIGMLGTVVYNQSRLNEINGQINKVTAQISTLDAENTQKQLEIDKRVSIRDVEETAKNEYGMVSVNNSQITYVRVGASGVEEKRMNNDAWSATRQFFEDIHAYISGE